MTDTVATVSGLQLRRPQRADARRNFDALLGAAREVFADQGTDASLEDVARRAGVGIGTLYRNFPTRRDLFESVYIGEVEDLCAAAQALAEALNHDSDVFRSCRGAMYTCGGPLLERAQAAGEARTDIDFDDVVRLISGITSGGFVDERQRDRVLQIALDGIRAPR